MGKQGIRSFALVCAGVLLANVRAVAFTPPRDGGVLPDTYYRVKQKNALAYTVERGWARKAAALRAAREEALVRGADPSFLAQAYPLGDTLRICVLPGYFSNEGTVPMSAALLQQQLFTSNATGTITDYYNEASYNQLTVTGDVYSWAKVSNTAATYYGSCNGVDPGCSSTGVFLEEILDLKDASVDFSKYDNDGPDGIANSPDDDGFVDCVVFVHSLVGGECGGPNFVSHTWSFTSWPNSGGLPYTTNDASVATGGNIKINDYVLAPALNCGAVAPYVVSEYIDIGVYCHELGHILGLPDLYDVDGGGTGIGHWGIMGSGNWNTPEKPAHFDAWCKKELGWVVPTKIGWQSTPVNIPDAETNAVSFQLPFSDEKFRRSNACVISGSYSLYCGLTAAETATRGYDHVTNGYGPNWYQTIERSFHYSGAGSVTLQYQYKFDLEPGYDFAETVIDVNGNETEIASYDGIGTGSANISLTPFLSPLAGAGGAYTIKFRVRTDISFDDADGYHESTCGAFAADNVSVTGGGESYTTGFETSVDGWHINPEQTRSEEYWLVENRRKTGFDVNLHGEGLLIWHVDEEVLKSPFLGNRGTNYAVRGLLLEEAEGVFDLNDMTNNGISEPLSTGEAADPFPGTSGNTSFTALSSPNSNDNLARPTRIEVTGISPAGALMTATMRAGDPGPQAGSASPNSIDNDQPATLVTVTGSQLRYGAAFKMTHDGEEIAATGLEWVDAQTLRGTVDVYARTAAPWAVVVTNPDGQTFTLDNAITVNPSLAARLVSASVEAVDDAVRLRYVLLEREPGEIIRLNRANGTGTDFRLIAPGLEPASDGEYRYVDREVEPGRAYTYLLESVTADGEVRELHRAVAVVPARELVLEQNVPNPFNPATSIRFYLPSRSDVRLDIYDVRGARVRSLAHGMYDSGSHAVDWDGTDAAGNRVASGFYVYRLVTDGRALSRKMMLLK